ncbi:MBL fold metallo-hydrolase [Actinocorallia longicatena]|uniref:Metallo-beta-lactamase domain-containing protein n=1 Tax=Actinocorallia longicatena TaxID=111803 RepID=A0ABP6QES0_9ACTN
MRSLDVRWIHGSESAKHNTDPDIQVHAYDPDTFILRQNKAINYEAPFLYLLFGADRAVLLDTGATASPELFPLRRTVDALIEDWRERNSRPSCELLVLHTHGHGDHVAGDPQFAGRPATTLVDASLASVQRFLGLPELGTARLELGGRPLECLHTPGHHDAAVTFFDPSTGFLLTGDTVYPGRLYVEDREAFTASIDRLIAFTDTRDVTQLLGCHIEMTTTPGVDYPVRTTYQPDEPPLQLPPSRLHAIRAALSEIGDGPGDHPYDDFVISLE